MKFRAIVATILFVVGLGVVYVYCQGRSAETASSGAPARAQEIATAAPVTAAGASGSVAISRVAAVSTNQTSTARGTLPFVVTSVGPFNKSLRQAVEAMGAKTVGVLSESRLLIEADAAALAKLTADRRFASVTERLPADKLEPALAALLKEGAESVQVSVVALCPADRETVRARVIAAGGEVLKGCIEGADSFKAQLTGEQIAGLAARGDVQWLETFKRPHLMNDRAVEPAAMNVQAVWEGLDGLSGAGQIVSTSDSGIDTGDLGTMHEDLSDRVVDMKAAEGCDLFDSNGHGTHTAGSIVGTGKKSEGRYRGTAWGATLRAWFCGKNGTRSIYTPTTAEELFRGNKDGTEWADSYLHSASWGSDMAGSYTDDCREYDRYVWEHPEYLPIFACGNAGDGARTVGSPGAAKNVLTVGATLNLSKGDASKTASFSSRGPCGDGRIKPDVAAPGDAVMSTRSTLTAGEGDYTSMSGTSMATPLTAGAVTLIREWLTRKPEFSDPATPPTAALMKAIVTGGAKDAAVPNNDQGWGRVDLAETLYPSGGRAVKLIDRIPFAQGFVTNIIITTTKKAPLDVQLVWIDYPGSAASSRALVNDLDLTVESRVLGEPFVRYGNGGDAPDTLNNVESVRIANAAATTYVITVNCKNILHDSTEGGAAALYIRGAFDPEAEAEEPEYVYLDKQGRGFMSLTRALEAVRDEGETVEIRNWVGFYRPVTLTNSCVIKAVDPAASRYVACQDRATLTVATNAMVSLYNVVFTNSTETFVTVDAGGCLELDNNVDLGLDAYQLSVKTARADGFRLAGSLTRRIMLHCDAATLENQVFGTYAGVLASDAANAAMIVCADDDDRELRGGLGPDNKLFWKVTPVPMDEASGYYVDTDGNTNASFRLERAVERFSAAYRAGKSSEFIARRDGRWSIPLALDAPLVIRGEGAVAPVVTCAGTYNPGECFFYVPTDASLTISNLVFTGYDASENADCSFICVDGGDLTLDEGAELNGIVGSTSYASGVIDLFAGCVTMLPGSSVVRCAAAGNSGCGGAIYVEGNADPTACVLNLFGGVITGCHAASYGGGVYVYASEIYHAQVNVKGGMMILGNTSPAGASEEDQADDLCFENVLARPYARLVGALEGRIGVRFATTADGYASSGNCEGDAFITCDAALAPEVVTSSAPRFFNDTDADLFGTAGSDGTLAWKRREFDGTWANEDEASAHVYLLDANGVATQVAHYLNLMDAIDYLPAGTVNRIEMYLAGIDSESLDRDLTLPEGCQVTLTAREASGYSIQRSGNVEFVVPAGASLTLTNITFTRTGSGSISKPYLNVDGGSLTLADKATVRNSLGNSSCDANAITVQREGTLTLLPGSLINHCYNYYNSTDDNDGVTTRFGKGSGVLLAGGTTAYLRGGRISDCGAAVGGGIFAMGGSTIYLSGDVDISNNKWLTYGGAVGGNGNLWVEDPATIYVDGALTGRIGAGYATNWETDTNLVARVHPDWAYGTDELTNSAACFFNDWTGEPAVAVTNATEAIIVWKSAVTNGVYTNAANAVYGYVGTWTEPEPPTPPPPAPQYEVITNKPTAIAFKSIVVTESPKTCTLTLTNLVKGARYAFYATNSLAGGFALDGQGPVTNFTAEADGEFILTVTPDTPALFWRATGETVIITNELNKTEE